ncbi:hypothetical protein [Maribacter sp. 2307UL18-2]|uniref:hypothetical protein n=1 Tax=Maribacter sp. 2307UL18-2 TaxID=3386274 RepID=UPI0039BCB934
MNHYIIIFILSFSLLSCSADRENIIVSGKVIEKTNGKPINNAEVVVLCWYEASFEEVSFKKKKVTTDGNGFFKTSFEKGHKIDVASKTKNHLPSRSYNTLNENRLEVILQLAKQKNNPTLVQLLSTENGFYPDNKDFPFLRVRVHFKDNQLDFNNQETFGFNFDQLTMTTDTSKSDFWFEPIEQEVPPSVIRTNPNGGVIPIFENEISSAVLYEKAIAPDKGYKNKYVLNGKEEGFFVLCKDGKTVGKLIFVKSSISAGGSDDVGNNYTEFGKHFNWIHQSNGSKNLSYPNAEIDLENFLVDYRLR